ncbi:MAG: hypothetical protein Q7T03_04600, partial [Deltaproteobacteria bacterium]|nr:hypothetical protein [Deltaproteobacteria bacterium]
PGERANTLSRIAFSLFRARMLDRGGSILQESLSIVESIPVVQTDTVWMNMSNCLVQIALLEDIRLREETMPLLAKADSFAMNVQNRQDRCKILVSNAFALARAGLLEKAASVFKESIIMVESMEGEPTRLNALKYIVSVLAHVDLKKHLIPVCKKLLVVVEPIHDERERSILGDNISNILYQNGFKGEIHVLRLWGPVKLFGHPIPLLTGPLIVTVK